MSSFLYFKGFTHQYLPNTSVTLNRYLYPLFHLLKFSLHINKVCTPHFISVIHNKTPLGEIYFVSFCNSSASFSCQFSLNGFFRFWNTKTKVLFCVYHILCQEMSPLSFIIRKGIESFGHFAICFIFTLSIIFAHRIVNIMLHCYCIRFTCRMIVDLKYFTCVRIISQLRFQNTVGTCVFMTWYCPTTFWFW